MAIQDFTCEGEQAAGRAGQCLGRQGTWRAEKPAVLQLRTPLPSGVQLKDLQSVAGPPGSSVQIRKGACLRTFTFVSHKSVTMY